MSKVAALKKAADEARADVLKAEQAAEELRRKWQGRIAAGGDDAELDALELEIMRAKRLAERKRVAEQQADDALRTEERAEQERERKAAANAFLTANHSMTQQLQQIDEAARRFLSLVQALPEDGGAWMEAMHKAKTLGSLPSVSPLPVPAEVLGAAKKAANYASFLQSRMH